MEDQRVQFIYSFTSLSAHIPFKETFQWKKNFPARDGKWKSREGLVGRKTMDLKVSLHVRFCN